MYCTKPFECLIPEWGTNALSNNFAFSWPKTVNNSHVVLFHIVVPLHCPITLPLCLGPHSIPIVFSQNGVAFPYRRTLYYWFLKYLPSYFPKIVRFVFSQNVAQLYCPLHLSHCLIKAGSIIVLSQNVVPLHCSRTSKFLPNILLPDFFPVTQFISISHCFVPLAVGNLTIQLDNVNPREPFSLLLMINIIQKIMRKFDEMLIEYLWVPLCKPFLDSF